MSRSLQESFILQASNIVMERLTREYASKLAALAPESEEAARIYNTITRHGFAAKQAAERTVLKRGSNQ